MENLDYMVAAYAIVWIVMFLYLMAIAAREKKIQKELAAMSRIVAEKERTTGNR